MDRGFPGGSLVKSLPTNAEDEGSILGPGQSPKGNDNPLQYSGLENSLSLERYPLLLNSLK